MLCKLLYVYCCCKELSQYIDANRTIVGTVTAQTTLPSIAVHRPISSPKMASENLGEFLTGNKIQSSPYSLKMSLEKCH